MNWLWGRPTNGSVLPLLMQRLRTTATLQDKRETLTEISSLPPFELAGMAGEGVVLLLITLTEYIFDEECIKRVLDILSTLTDPGPEQAHFLDIILQNDLRGPSLLLDVLQSSDFYVRFPVVQLMTRILEHNPDVVIQHILVNPNGISLLVDLLDDLRESIRNEGLLLLKALVATNPEMQKIVSFSNAFERLFKIINDEGGICGGIVALDCFDVMCNLLRNDVSLRSFREMRYGKLLYPIMCPSQWPAYNIKVEEVLLKIVGLIHLLLHCSNNSKAAELDATKKSMCDCKLIDGLLNICAQSALSPTLHSKALSVLSIIIDRHEFSQQIVISYTYEMNDNIMSGMAMLMKFGINHKTDEQNSILALDVLRKVISTPRAQLFVVCSVKNIEKDNASCGQVLASTLVGAALSTDSILAASVILSCALSNNKEAKEQLFKASWTDTSFFTCLFLKLIEAIKRGTELIAIALFRVFLVWLDGFSDGVLHVAEDGGSFLFLMQTAISDSEGIHVQGLCSLLIGLLCLYFPEELTNGGSSLTKTKMFDQFIRRLGFHQFSHKWNSLRSQWYQTHLWTSGYDDLFVEYLKSLHGRIDSFVQQQINCPTLSLVETPTKTRLPNGNVHDENHSSSFHQYVQSQEELIASLQSENEKLLMKCTDYKRLEELVAQQAQELESLKKQSDERIQALLATQKQQEGALAKQVKDLTELRTLVAQKDLQLNEERSKSAIQKSMSEESINALNQQIQAYEKELAALSQTYAMLEQTLAHQQNGTQVESNVEGLNSTDCEELLILVGELSENMNQTSAFDTSPE